MSYINGKIYQIVCKKTNQKYIGSTKLSINERFEVHKEIVKYKTKNGLLYDHMNKYNIKNFSIKLIEYWPCNNKKELLMREGYHQVLNNTVKNGLNSIYAYLPPHIKKIIKSKTDKKYREGPKREELLEKKRIYQQENKEHISEKRREERAGENREKILEAKRISYQKNKAKGQEKIKCNNCDREMTKRSLARHLKEACKK